MDDVDRTLGWIFDAGTASQPIIASLMIELHDAGVLSRRRIFRVLDRAAEFIATPDPEPTLWRAHKALAAGVRRRLAVRPRARRRQPH